MNDHETFPAGLGPAQIALAVVNRAHGLPDFGAALPMDQRLIALMREQFHEREAAAERRGAKAMRRTCVLAMLLWADQGSLEAAPTLRRAADALAALPLPGDAGKPAGEKP